MTIKVARLLAENVAALLRRHGYNQHALATWCKRSDPWVSDFINKQRGWKIEDLDRVSDLFGLEPYQLFQPGIVEASERRKNNRRSDKDRRLTKEQRIMMPTVANIDSHHPRRKGELSHATSAHLARVVADLQVELQRILQREQAAKEDARIAEALTRPRPRGRNPRGSNPGHAPEAD